MKSTVGTQSMSKQSGDQHLSKKVAKIEKLLYQSKPNTYSKQLNDRVT